MKINVTITDMTPEEAQNLVPVLMEHMKNPKVVLHTAEEEKPAKIKAERPAEPQPVQDAPVSAREAQEEKKEIKSTNTPTSRRDAKSAAVRKIQAGFKDEVKALILTYTETGKVDEIPEDKLTEFVEKIGGIGA